MSTAAIIAIVVIVAVILLAVLVLTPRMRRTGAERRMDQRRSEEADRHRGAAEARQAQADVAEREARRARAEADLHESRAELHERGMADEDLPAAGDPDDRRFQRDREMLDDASADRPRSDRR